MSREVDLERLSDEERAELDHLLTMGKPWTPLPGPQSDAYYSEADITGYGGAAGGGKTNLAIGTAITNHRIVAIFRENGTELTAIVDDIARIVGGRDRYAGQEKIWRLTRYDGEPLQIELGSFPNPGDETKYQGRPHDLIVFDEAANMRPEPVRFLMGWLRTTTPGQRCRVVMCFNPPTTVEGRWVMDFFAPWLDKKHPNPAADGELRWFVSKDGLDIEVDGPDPWTAPDGEVCQPVSRTFISSRVTDNPFLMGTNYYRQLQSLPEPLRSQMLFGDFAAGVEDDPWQVIPTRWVELAQERWQELGWHTERQRKPPMDSIGVDVAMRGKDATVIARRHGMWFDEPIKYDGHVCVDGPTVGGFVLAAQRDKAVVHIDLFGVGAQPYGHLMGVGVQVIGCNVGEPARGTAEDGRLTFRNWRSELWWRMREALDPSKDNGIALPPSKELLADLCCAKWKLSGPAIQVDGREELIKRIGRSPDVGTAYILALLDTPKRSELYARGARARKNQEFDPYAEI